MIVRPLAALGALLLAACGQADQAAPDAPASASAVAPLLTTPDAVDVHSFARPLEARVTHVALDLAVDFTAKRLAGTATLDILAKPGVKSIILDDKGLEIASIATPDGKPLPYKVGTADSNLGAPLDVTIGDARKIVVTYKSAPDSGALQWLTPQQTAGKKLPYLFSQGESIENRSWIPTQDSPGIRQSWEAVIHVPSPLTAVMSAPSAGVPTAVGQQRAFSFRMDHPVAPYLIALAVGDLAFKPLGPRTGVWTEPSMLDAAARELEDSEKMVSAAEAIYGPYRWGRYDMLVLPPSFPYGGMENPTLTFLTPTIIAGDKSLTSVVAHELAHSWSGNLATNATWADFWLNEGMTTYAERRIVEVVYGPKMAMQQVALGIDAQDKAVVEGGGPAGPDTRLHLDLKGRHPNDGLTDIAYEKGAAFLRMIEANVGRARFDAYLKGWFDRHAFQPVTSAMFLADLRANLVKGDPALEKKLMLDDWVYKPGIPANAVKADPAAFAEADAATAAFAKGGAVDTPAWGRWTTDERLRFLNTLPRKLPPARLAALDQGLGLDSTRNSEVLFAWLDLATRNRYDPAVPALERFMTSIGRGKFVKPLYKTLYADASWGRPIAKRVYVVARPLYHPLVTRDVDKTMAGK
ncbi:MAG: M1 family metallopeptidase [Sphingomicrobium sp.]